MYDKKKGGCFKINECVNSKSLKILIQLERAGPKKYGPTNFGFELIPPKKFEGIKLGFSV